MIDNDMKDLPDIVEEEEAKRAILEQVAEILNRRWGDQASVDSEGPKKDYDISVRCVGSVATIKHLEVVITEVGSGARTYYTLGPDGDLVETSPPVDQQQ
jgi:hypothetical protein